ncbi:MAG: MgtC/SapB family protein [Oscillospiraceae bacterium]|nr:MgtC/SapB family protein [Oscillospiraceae bacterium]
MLFLTANVNIPALGIGQICLRLLCAMVIGLIIGTEREYTNRPAGMRTHILVALGACAVMITGQLIFREYSAYGAAPDPARLGAQVITGVGFLGAGTILREGATVKGLTTAASLWAVACLGLAAGGGYYAIALAGMVFIFLTLTILEVFQHKLIGPLAGEQSYVLTVTDLEAGLEVLNKYAQSYQGNIHRMELSHDEAVRRICFVAEFGGLRGKKRHRKFLEKLAAQECVLSITAAEMTGAAL